jgi:hypothetical protein
MSDGDTAAFHIHLAAIDRAQRLRQPEPVPAEFR